MPIREGNDVQIPYFTPGESLGTKVKFTTDDANYDTLKEMRDELGEQLEALYKDFNAFDVLTLIENKTADEVAKAFVIKAAGRQEAYNILLPIFSRLDSVVTAIDTRFMEQNNKKG